MIAQVDNPLETLAQRYPWRPLFWEPVAGTGERIMVGVLHAFAGEVAAVRTVRDDLLEALYGRASEGARRLIDASMTVIAAAARSDGVGCNLGVVMGIHLGPLRETPARSPNELLHTAALLYSSLTSLDHIYEAFDADSEPPQQDAVSRRFSNRVEELVVQRRPDLAEGFGRRTALVEGGQKVRFGYLSPNAVIHFAVLNAMKLGPSVRDARARLFELQRARELARIPSAALIAEVPRENDPALGARRRASLSANQRGVAQEAASVPILWHAVHSAEEAAERLLSMA